MERPPYGAATCGGRSPSESGREDTSVSHIIQRLLVATDGSDPSEAALEFALQLARAHTADLLICNVVDYTAAAAETSVALGVDLSGTFAALDDASKGILRAASARARDAGVKANAFSLQGMPVTAIVAYAIEREVDAIVLATRGRGGLTHLLLGSTAEGVLRSASVPVFVVHAKCEVRDLHTIFVAVDNSDPANAAAELATELAISNGGRLVIEHVVDEDALSDQTATLGSYVSDIQDEWEREGRTLVQSVAERAERSGVREVEADVVFGNPVDEIVARSEAAKAHLIAIGTHGRRGLSRLAMGSVAESVVRRSRIPVVIVRSFAELNARRRAQADVVRAEPVNA